MFRRMHEISFSRLAHCRDEIMLTMKEPSIHTTNGFSVVQLGANRKRGLTL